MCFHEWNPNAITEIKEEEKEDIAIKDANGNILQDGDTVVVIKDLPVKGASKAVKAGTKVKNIRLTDGDHNIDCRIEGFGAMSLKSEFVRKA
jgi:protein PhnA